MKNKKAISAVVATVLIILITVAAVAIIWVAIIPMIKNYLNFDVVSDINIITDTGHTIYDSDKKIVAVLIENKENIEISNLVVSISILGDSKSYITPDVPKINERKLYCFDVSPDEIGRIINSENDISKIGVSPVILNGKKKMLTETSSISRISKGSVDCTEVLESIELPAYGF